MIYLLKCKDSFLRILGRYEIHVFALIRFVIAFTAFSMINYSIHGLDHYWPALIALLLAIACAFLPSGVMLFLAAMLILLNFYFVSSMLAGMALLLFVIMFFLYFRFTSGKGLYAILTAVLSAAGIPYVMPVSVGLLGKPVNVISVLCGSATYFMIRNVRAGAALFTAADGPQTNAAADLPVIGRLLIGNMEMYVFLIGYATAAVIVWVICRIDTDYSREKALIAGCVAQLVILSIGELALGQPSRIFVILAGCVVSAGIAWLVSFFTLSLDYSRVERQTFEDDEYYYYVKAVPKISVAADKKELVSIHSNEDPDAGFFSDEGGWGDDLDIREKQEGDPENDSLTEKETETDARA